MRIRDIIEAKKLPQEKSPKGIVGKHKHNGNYDPDKFKGKKKEEREKTVREQVEEAIAQEITA